MTVDKITDAPTQNELIDKVNDVIDNLGDKVSKSGDTMTGSYEITDENGTTIISGGIINCYGGDGSIDVGNGYASLDQDDATINIESGIITIYDGVNGSGIHISSNADVEIYGDTLTIPTSSSSYADIGSYEAISAGWLKTNAMPLKQDVSNLVTSLSSNSTDTQYPSAKCVYNELGNKANTSSLSTVATTGDYDDLTNKPTIPTVGNGTITITQGGTTKGTFTTNQSGNTTISLDGGSSGTPTDVQVNGTSITSNGVANLVTNTAYNSSSNKIATMSDIPDNEVFVVDSTVSFSDVLAAYNTGKTLVFKYYNSVNNNHCYSCAYNTIRENNQIVNFNFYVNIDSQSQKRLYIFEWSTLSSMWTASYNQLLGSGTVTSVNNVSPVNGNVTLSIPDVSTKMDNTNPTGTGALSINRKASTTVGTNSVAVGYNGTASGDYSMACGSGNTASGNQSLVSGYQNTASGNNTFAIGRNNTAGYTNQAVVGKYNSNKSDTFFEVGNGASTSARSNAFEVYSDGTISTDNGTTKVKLESLQATSNLVTSVSSASTDSQYPSAKLFYDTVGNIETLINAL